MDKAIDRAIATIVVFVVLLLQVSCAPGVPSEKALLSYAKASAAFEDGMFPQAREMAAKTRKANPGFRQAAMLEGKAAWFSGDARGSAALFRKLGGGKGDPVSSLWLARALRSSGDASGAKKAVESALSADPDDPRTLRLAAQISADSGDEAAERAYLDKALSSGAELALAYLDRARSYWTAGESEKALADLGAAHVLLSPDSSARGVVEKLMDTINDAGAVKK